MLAVTIAFWTCGVYKSTRQSVNTVTNSKWNASWTVKVPSSLTLTLTSLNGKDTSHPITWDPRSNVYPELIKEFEIEHDKYVQSWQHRCDVCDLPWASSRGIKIHKCKAHKEQKPQHFEDRLVEKAIKVKKLKEQQLTRPVIQCEGKSLDFNLFSGWWCESRHRREDCHDN